MNTKYLALIAVVVCLASAVRADETSGLVPLDTSLSSTTLEVTQTLPFPTTPVFPTPSFEYETLNFNLAASQQAFVDTKVASNTYVSTATLKNSKITSKHLLTLLATACNTNWPAGAQLALENLSAQLFVVDKTGTNPICNLSMGMDENGTNVTFTCSSDGFNIYTDNSLAAYRGKALYKQVHYGMISFHLFVQVNGQTVTDLSFDGLDTSNTTVNKNSSVTQRDQATVAGSGWFNSKMLVLTGQINGVGTWTPPPAAVPVGPTSPDGQFP